MFLLKKLADIIDQINSFVGKAVSWLVVIMVLNVFLVVVLRYVFSIGWVWMQELYVWTHATIFMLGAGYTLLHEGQVRIDLIYRTASARYKALVNIFGSLFFALPLMFLLFSRSVPMVERSFQSLEKSAEAGGLPALYILKAVIPLFCILFGLQFISLIIRSLEALFNPSNTSPSSQEQQEQSS
ncbi:MAG: TRAP transporter small permease subunit [Hyphomicrobiales bacterium]